MWRWGIIPGGRGARSEGRENSSFDDPAHSAHPLSAFQSGRVQMLEDTDKDGVYDKATTFLEGLAFPNGIHCWRGGVIVTMAPEIFYAEDSDGDGKADVRETLYKGFVEGNQQHRVNGLRWGLDGWLYLANGDSGGEVAGTGIMSRKSGERKSSTPAESGETQDAATNNARADIPLSAFLFPSVVATCEFTPTPTGSTRSAGKRSSVANETTSETGSATTIRTRSINMCSKIATCDEILTPGFRR